MLPTRENKYKKYGRNMEQAEQFLKELQALEHLYKTNFDLVSQKVDNQAQQIENVTADVKQMLADLQATNNLLKDVISEKDVQIQKLIKATAALTVIATQLTERFNAMQQV